MAGRTEGDGGLESNGVVLHGAIASGARRQSDQVSLPTAAL